MDGITYEKQSLMEHFHKVGYFDPLTRRDSDPFRIVENPEKKKTDDTKNNKK